MPRAEHAGRVQEMLRIVELEGLEKRKPRQLSGGQQQRVALARALVNSPAALLLDEPLGALDVKLRKQMQLRAEARSSTTLGTTFVYVTHDQEEALAMSDRIAVMNGGRVEQIGSPREIYDAALDCFRGGLHRLAERARAAGSTSWSATTRSRGSTRASAWSSPREPGTQRRATRCASRCGPSRCSSRRRRRLAGRRLVSCAAESPRSSSSACTRSSTSTRAPGAWSPTAWPTSRSAELEAGTGRRARRGSRSDAALV